MMNTMQIEGYRAIIQYDPEIEMFRGEIIDLNGGADFYAKVSARAMAAGKSSNQWITDLIDQSIHTTRDGTL